VVNLIIPCVYLSKTASWNTNSWTVITDLVTECFFNSRGSVCKLLNPRIHDQTISFCIIALPTKIHSNKEDPMGGWITDTVESIGILLNDKSAHHH
jgi:hypothetical protein